MIRLIPTLLVFVAGTGIQRPDLPQRHPFPSLAAHLEELRHGLRQELQRSNPSLALLRTERQTADAMRAIADVASRPTSSADQMRDSLPPLHPDPAFGD